MFKGPAKERIETALSDAAASVEALDTPGTALEADLAALRRESTQILSGWSLMIADAVVSALEARARQISDTAQEVRKVLRERQGAMGQVAQLRARVNTCGPDVRAGLERPLTVWTEKLAAIGLDCNRPVDAQNEHHLVVKLRVELTRFTNGADRLGRANLLLAQLRERGGGALPLSAAELNQVLPDLERDFVRSGADAAWLARLDAVMAGPLKEWETPALPPEDLNRARALFERLLRWNDVLGAARRPVSRMAELEEQLVDAEAQWRTHGGVDPTRILERIQATVDAVQHEARAIRIQRAERLGGDVALLRAAGLDGGALDGLVSRLSREEIHSPEHHERWSRQEEDARRSVERALTAAAATGDLREYLEAAAASARTALAAMWSEALTGALAQQVVELENDLRSARPDQASIDGWLSALRVVGGAAARLEQLRERRDADLQAHHARLLSLANDVAILEGTASTIDFAPLIRQAHVDACRVAPGERLDLANTRVQDAERRLVAEADRLDRALRAKGESALRAMSRLEGQALALGAPLDATPMPTLPVEWRGWAAALDQLARRGAEIRERRADALARRRDEAADLSARLDHMLTGVLPLEDRERAERVLERLRSPPGDDEVEALLTGLTEGRELVQQLTEADTRLSSWHAVLLRRLDALRDEGFRVWNPEINHRASALVKGIGPEPPVPWSELEGQLLEADNLLTRLEVEGTRRAAAEVDANVAALRRADQRAPDPAISRLLDEVARLPTNTLPRRPLRVQLRDAARRLK